MSTAGAFVLLAALVAMAFAILIAMTFLFARLTGWSKLARLHPARRAFAGKRFRVQGAILGPWGWNAPPMSLGVDDAGLDLRALPPFALAFRPIYVPWPAIESVARREALFFDFLELRFGREAEGTIGVVGSPALLSRIEVRHANSLGN